MHPNLNFLSRTLKITLAIFPLIAFAATTRADIFQWEYINPADQSQGKRQSTTLAPDGAGVDAAPGAYLAGRNLTMAYLVGADLKAATLTGADFAGALVHGAGFAPLIHSFGIASGTGITLEQLYSTVSYQDHFLAGIGLSGHVLTGANFAGQNLRGANFGIIPSNSLELSGDPATLTGASLREADLHDANFHGANLTGADFSGAKIQGANFSMDYWAHGSGITVSQLYSTASFQAHDLREIDLGGNDLVGGSFSGQKLTNSSFGHLYYAINWQTGRPEYQVLYATLTGADFSGADTRGAYYLDRLDSSGATTTNLIGPDGHIDGLDLSDGQLLVVRNYDSEISTPYPFPITVDQHFAMDTGGTLRMELESEFWNSTISFALGDPVALGGTLELTFPQNLNPAALLGRTFDLFDWTGVNPTGAFAISSPYKWDVSHLYTTGEVSLASVPEPGCFVLAVSTLAAAFGLRRRHPRPSRTMQIAFGMISLLMSASVAHADIFQWEYIDPIDPGHGKRQSGTLVPEGADVDATPGANLSRRDLSMAYLNDVDLSLAFMQGVKLQNASLVRANLLGADFSLWADVIDTFPTDLSGADFSHANLRNANFLYANLRDANLSDADVRGGSFGGCCWAWPTRLTLAQLYSTASYKTRDMSGIQLVSHSLANASFANQNLTHAGFTASYLAGADFSGADIRGASFRIYSIGCCVPGSGISPEQLYSTASYQQGDLTEIDFLNNYLTGANFVGQNLAGANFTGATLTDANFTDAQIRGAYFSQFYYDGIAPRIASGLTLTQLYSTASYRSRDLSEIVFGYNDFTNANFAGQNLTNTVFGVKISGADFTCADTRGASIDLPDSAISTNLIRPDGHVSGLDLGASDLLVLRDYDGDAAAYPEPTVAIPVAIDQHLMMHSGGTLRMLLEADAWDSTVSFEPGIAVALGGTLELKFAADVNVASQVSRTFDLFDWTGVSPTGAFRISSPYVWDLSHLYTTGEVTLTAVPEPSTGTLAAAIGLCYLRYQRRRQNR